MIQKPREKQAEVQNEKAQPPANKPVQKPYKTASNPFAVGPPSNQKMPEQTKEASSLFDAPSNNVSNSGQQNASALFMDDSEPSFSTPQTAACLFGNDSGLSH
eukprot:CAMPEP_0168608378 /NCGR_PEP_ID=MMETSP0449_2-20121227/595_1 /TAXON_ID=1082188 /ORGANISM="Strombidium rassoulzadegani, Strain ras09" /LENGTH=102 /DNA_ID=CAMNT_0008648359 /DNA_START=78 /DNA_END=386 /DNA_ORIENTATION=-